MLRRLIALLCVLWVAGTVWFHIYDDLALFMYGEPAMDVAGTRVVEVNPAVEFFSDLMQGEIGQKTRPVGSPEPVPPGADPVEVGTAAFYRVDYQYKVAEGTWYHGNDTFVQAEPPADLPNLKVRFDPTRPWVSRVEDHFELWPYLTTLLALVLLVVMMLRQQEATRRRGTERDPVRQFNLKFNQLKRDWELISPKTWQGMERQALAWSDDVLVLKPTGDEGSMVALARLFIIYQDPEDGSRSQALDATAVFRHTDEGWVATDELEHDVPEKVKSAYPRHRIVHERIDQNRDILFEELIKRTGRDKAVELDDGPSGDTDKKEQDRT